MDDSAVLAEMAEEFTARWRRGERPEVEEYAAKVPALAERVRALFPTLMLLEGLAAGGAAQEEEETPRAEMPRPGEVFGAYKVGAEIGRGGMGVVFEAEHLVLHRKVALKVLPLRGGDAGSRLERFLREARTAASLHHGNIVPVFDVGQVNGTPYFAMQLIDGVSLDRLGRTPPAPTTAEGDGIVPPPAPAATVTVPEGAARHRWAAEVGRQAAEGLAHAHARGVVHRDIKPSNLMIDGSGVVWVTDFGLAKRLEEDVALTHSGQIVGTPRYASPEQAAASKKPIDHRTDVYSLGATLYELVTRRPAFDGPTPLDVLMSIIERQPVPPRALDATIPRDLETVILKAMSKRPEDRYQTAHDVAEDLRRFLAGEPVKARRIGPVGKAVRWAQRNPALAAMTVLVFLSLTGGTVASTLFALHADAQRQNADRRAEAEVKARRQAADNLYLTQVNLAATAWRDGEDARVRDLLDRMLPVGGEDRRGWEWHFLDRQVNGKTSAQLAALLGAKDGPQYPSYFLSTDARRVVLFLALGGNQARLDVLDADTGRLLGRCHCKTGHATFRDDARAAAWRDGGKVILWDVDADRTSAFDAPGEGGLLALCPSGGRLAFNTSKLGEVALLDLQTGKCRLLEQVSVGTPLSYALQFSPDGRWLAGVEQFPLLKSANLSDVSITFWDADGGRIARRVPGYQVALGRNGKAVVADGTVLRRYDLASRRESGLVALGEAKESAWGNLRLSEEGWLAAMNEDFQVWLFSVDDGRPPRRVRPRKEAHDFAFRGRSLLRTLGEKMTFDEFDLSEWERQWFPAPLLDPDQHARDAAGTRLAFASVDGDAKAAGRPRVDVFGPDGQPLLSSPLAWPYYQVIPSLDATGKTVAWAAFSSPLLGPNEVVAAESDLRRTLGSCLTLWLPTGGLPDVLRVASVLGFANERCDVEVREVATGRLLLRESVASKPGSWTRDVAELSPDGRHYLSGAEGRFVVWDVTAGVRVALPLGEEVRLARFVPGGRLAVVGTDGERLWAGLWDLAGPRRLWLVDAGEGRRVSHLQGDADVLAFVRNGTSVRCLSLRDGSSLIAEESLTPVAVNVSLALGGSRLAVGLGKRLVVWDTATGERVLSRDGFDGSWAPALLPGGRLALVFLRKRGVHVHLLDGRGEHLATLSLPRKQGRTEPHLPPALDTWVSGHRLHVLYRATLDVWEMHTLDGTPR